MRRPKKRRRTAAASSVGSPPASTGRRRRGYSARERNLRRLESNERERMRMHSLNRAFEVIRKSYNDSDRKCEWKKIIEKAEYFEPFSFVDE